MDPAAPEPPFSLLLQLHALEDIVADYAELKLSTPGQLITEHIFLHCQLILLQASCTS